MGDYIFDDAFAFVHPYACPDVRVLTMEIPIVLHTLVPKNEQPVWKLDLFPIAKLRWLPSLWAAVDLDLQVTLPYQKSKAYSLIPCRSPFVIKAPLASICRVCFTMF